MQGGYHRYPHPYSENADDGAVNVRVRMAEWRTKPSTHPPQRTSTFLAGRPSPHSAASGNKAGCPRTRPDPATLGACQGPGRAPDTLDAVQPLGRRVQTTVISPVTAPSARRISMVTGNSGRCPASSSATTSAAGRPRVAVAVTAPMASFL